MIDRSLACGRTVQGLLRSFVGQTLRHLRLRRVCTLLLLLILF